MPARPTDQTRPFRSVLYIPGANERALEKARGLAADAIIFDLEDAVSPEEKVAARSILAGVLKTGDYGRRVRIVRVNGLDTAWGRDDIAAFAGLDIDALLIPKVGSAADVEAVAGLSRDIGLWAMMENPAGMLHAAEIAAHLRLTGMVMGTNDLAKDLGARFQPDRMPLLAGLQLCLLAARAAGIVIVDGVYNAFRDEEGLRRECNQGRDMGFDGKTLIHPAQLAVANEVFAPSAKEIDLARRQIDAYEAARAEGRGVAVLDGRIVENLHAAAARATLDRAGAIAEMGL